MKLKKVKSEKVPGLGKACMLIFVAIVGIALLIAVCSAFGYEVVGKEFWFDLLKMSFGFVVGYLFTENRYKEK